MPVETQTITSPDGVEVHLKDPVTAAILAWLIPGAGHLYQGRTGKGILFLVCILGSFCYGVFLGEGRVVYASMRPDDRRLPYLCQIGVGLPAMPALVQAYRVRNAKPPLWNGFMAPPKLQANHFQRDEDTLDAIHKRLHHNFELGTVYTMVAGLLNILVIYDAARGPAFVLKEEEQAKEGEKTPGKDDKGGGD